MTPQRRTALVSVLAALALVVLKLATGLATGSLGLVSEALHSGTDLVAALLTFFAVGVAARPADTGHPYGHGKAEHLAALAEAGILVLASLLIAGRAISNLVGASEPSVDVTWYALAVIGLVIAIDASRVVVSHRAGRRYRSAALQANAIHFAGDLAGSVAVLAGLAGRVVPATRTATRSRRCSSPCSCCWRPGGSCAGTSTCSWTARLRTHSKRLVRRSRVSARPSSYAGCGCGRRRGATSRTS